MVLGIRERTGRSVTPKTDRTAVDFVAVILLHDFVAVELGKKLGVNVSKKHERGR